eukprot:1148584-Pelagomonas_calceolata.AAC.1
MQGRTRAKHAAAAAASAWHSWLKCDLPVFFTQCHFIHSHATACVLHPGVLHACWLCAHQLTAP